MIFLPENLIHHRAQAVDFVVVNGDEDGAILGEELFEELEAGPHHAEPFVVALEVVALDGVGAFFSHSRMSGALTASL